MEYIEYLGSDMMLAVSIAMCLIAFLVRLPYLFTTKEFIYSYHAKTKYRSFDHRFKFSIKLVNGSYRCYIERTPPFRGRNTSKYIPHYWTEQGTNRHYICWTGTIKYPKQAKTLCRKWSDATQQFIDTGIPAPGFGGK